MLPNWFKQDIPNTELINKRIIFFKQLRLNTVCQSAHCPNIARCFSNNQATFMILGSKCARDCRFCAVDKGRPEPIDNLEPLHIAEAVDNLGLDYVVITSVTRDDLSDGGAEQFAKTIGTIRACLPAGRRKDPVNIEVLIPDFRVATEKEYLNADIRRLPALSADRHTNVLLRQGFGGLSTEALAKVDGRRFTNFNLRESECNMRESALKTSLINLGSLKIVLAAKPDILGHNIETVPRLYPKVRPQANYNRSISLLKKAKEFSQSIITKSALMLGLGENFDEILECMRDLRDVDCDILVLGQYLSPSDRHIPVERFYSPEEFDELEIIGLSKGFRTLVSGPLVRSSYKAKEVFEQVASGEIIECMT